jgi:hypothetical protein
VQQVTGRNLPLQLVSAALPPGSTMVA